MKTKMALSKNVITLGQNRFAQGLNFYKLFWIFLIGCIIGVLLETVIFFVFFGNLECRWGVIYGPFNPVYGFGAVVMTLVLNKMSKVRDIWIFIICMVIGGGYEYLCSLIQELLFGSISWNYKDTMFNLHGRTNLFYSLCWGLLGLVWIRYAYPRISKLIEKMPMKSGKVLTWVLAVFMVLNMVISGLATWRQAERLAGSQPSNSLDSLLDKVYPDEFLKKIYPNMEIVKAISSNMQE